jgi:hypothetical protein
MNLDPAAIQALAGRLRTLASDLEILLHEEPVVEHPSFEPLPAIPANQAVDVTKPGAYAYVRLTEEYKQLTAIIGNGKIRGEGDWAPWARLVQQYKWVNVIKGADRTEPSKRWPGEVEQVILNKIRSKQSVY